MSRGKIHEESSSHPSFDLYAKRGTFNRPFHPQKLERSGNRKLILEEWFFFVDNFECCLVSLLIVMNSGSQLSEMSDI